MATIYVGNDHTISVTELKDQAGNTVTGATVVMSLLDKRSRVVVTGLDFPLTLAEGTAGNYSVVMDKAVEVDIGSKYYVSITAVSGTMDAQWDIEVGCSYRAT